MESGKALKKILFITPFFGRTGSEMQLLYILENLNTNKYQPFLFARNDGSLLSKLPENIKHFIGYKKHKNLLLRVFRLILYALNVNPVKYQLEKIQKKVKADCWYINTVANRDAYELAVKLGVKVVAHIHEMPLYFDMVKDRTIENMLKSEVCIGCSKIVCETLEDMGHKNTKLLYSFVDEDFVTFHRNSSEIKNQFNLKKTDFVWTVSGSANSIKGVDLVIPLLKKLGTDHKIIWIGHIENSGTAAYAQIAGAALFNERLFFVGRKSEDYYDYLNVGDAFLLLSRQDSFPLVMQEAGYLGMPIAGFNSGGIAEYVDDKIGIVVDGLSYDALAGAMEKIKQDYKLYDKSYIKAHARSFNASQQTQKLEVILDELLNR